MSDIAWIVSLTVFLLLVICVSVYVLLSWYKNYFKISVEKDRQKSYSEEESEKKPMVLLRLQPPCTPPFSGEVREVHVQPKSARKFSEPDRFRKYSDPPPYRKQSDTRGYHVERSRTISESTTLSGPATPLGTLDPELYFFDEEIESPFEREALRASCNLGKVQFIVDYDHHRHVLLVRVVQATNLIVPANIIDHNSDQPCNPYAIIQLLPDFENQLQTNVKRKTSNPRFDETFEFDIETKKIQDQSLWITLMSFDSFAKHDVIGQAVLSLREVDLAKPNVFLKDLEPSKKELQLGEILISLGYLKSAERLTLVIIKARNLLAVNIKSTDPYVKVTLLQDGKRIKKKKTTTKKGDLNPIYHEAVSFDLTADQLDTVDLLISVMHGNDIIGSVLIGSNATDSELKLWQRMYNSDRPVPHWSKLQDPKLYN